MTNVAQASDYGIVYLLTNPAMPGIVKIGMTNRADLEIRLKELYGTGVPVPFECSYACKVKKENAKKTGASSAYRIRPVQSQSQTRVF